MKTKNATVKLKNLYTGDIVFTESYDMVRIADGKKFIEVWNSDNPNRKFLVNRDAFTVVKDK
jgi:hypothetical protein